MRDAFRLGNVNTKEDVLEMLFPFHETPCLFHGFGNLHSYREAVLDRHSSRLFPLFFVKVFFYWKDLMTENVGMR